MFANSNIAGNKPAGGGLFSGSGTSGTTGTGTGGGGLFSGGGGSSTMGISHFSHRFQCNSYLGGGTGGTFSISQTNTNPQHENELMTVLNQFYSDLKYLISKKFSYFE